MRNAVSKKLHSQTGASLLIALLFFLAAMTVGAVVLTAAATNAGRMARDRREQQNYLAAASAALLVKEDFRGTALTVGYTKVITETTVSGEDSAGNPYTYVVTSAPDYSKTPPALTGGRLLKGEPPTAGPADDLAELCYSTADVLHTDPPAAMEYPLKFTADDLPDVYGAMTVDQTDGARYTVTVRLYTQMEDGTHTNTTTLLFTPAVSNTQSTEREYGTDTETIKTIFTTTITWGAPVITKGGTA